MATGTRAIVIHLTNPVNTENINGQLPV